MQQRRRRSRRDSHRTISTGHLGASGRYSIRRLRKYRVDARAGLWATASSTRKSPISGFAQSVDRDEGDRTLHTGQLQRRHSFVELMGHKIPMPRSALINAGEVARMPDGSVGVHVDEPRSQPNAASLQLSGPARLREEFGCEVNCGDAVGGRLAGLEEHLH